MAPLNHHAVDSDGDASSNSFTVTVVDDVPTAHVGDAGFVNEANLPNGNAPLFFAYPSTSGDLHIVWGADNNDSGSTHNRSVTFESNNAALDVQVSLPKSAGKISFRHRGIGGDRVESEGGILPRLGIDQANARIDER